MKSHLKSHENLLQEGREYKTNFLFLNWFRCLRIHIYLIYDVTSSFAVVVA